MSRVLAPQPGPQEDFLASRADIAIVGGAAGVGKTYALLLEVLRHHRNPRFFPVIFRRTYPRITQAGGMWDESTELYHGIAKANTRDHSWTFPSGSRLTFSHLQHESTRLDYKGAQIPLIGWDQLEEFTERQFWYLLSRNRSVAGIRPYIRATCNPVPDDDPTGGWLHRLLSWWIDDESGYAIAERSGVVRFFIRDDDTLVWADTPAELRERFDIEPQSITFIPGTLADNPILEAKDPSYRSKLQALPRVERERLLAGNWKIRASAGDFFRRSYFDVLEAAPTEVVSRDRVRSWDLAASEAKLRKDDPDYTVGLRVSRTPGGLFVVEHMERFREDPGKVPGAVKRVAKHDGKGYRVRLPQDPGQAGKAQAHYYTTLLAGWEVRTKPVTGDKTVRAGPASAQAEAGNIAVVRAPWNEAFFRELEMFPNGGHDDIVDALSDAVDEITDPPPRRKLRVWYPGMPEDSQAGAAAESSVE